jgi:hypothetical protein
LLLFNQTSLALNTKKVASFISDKVSATQR